MNETTLLIAFIAVTSVAIVIQMLMLVGMFFSVRKMSESVQALQRRMDEQVTPLVETVRAFVDENAPRIQTSIENITDTTALIRAQAIKVDQTISGIAEIASTQAANAGALAARTIHRLDSTASAVQHAVVTPVRRASALLEAVAIGIGDFAERQKAQRTKNTSASDEMFV
jgi:ABC-type transporter Mla subunit MlaD